MARPDEKGARDTAAQNGREEEDARTEARAVDEGDPTRTIVSNDPDTPEPTT